MSHRYDALEGIEENVPLPNNDQYDPNHTLVYTINSLSDTNNFCNTYNHNNGYNGLKLGQTIKINNSGYDTSTPYGSRTDIWYIAGFDMEHNQIAADDTIYDNGYGICLIPERYAIGANQTPISFHSNNENVGYVGSDMHKTILPNWVNSYLKSKLGNHLINRNVLLSNRISNDSYIGSSSYVWTTSYATLMSGCQLIGLKSSFMSKYDDGEANYKLPLFNYIYSAISSGRYWLRGMFCNGYEEYKVIDRGGKYLAHTSTSVFNSNGISEYMTFRYIRPMIYIR